MTTEATLDAGQTEVRWLRMGRGFAQTGAFIVLGLGSVGCGSESEPPASRVQPGIEVTVSSGPIRGEEREGLRIFRGIPFAAPPLGALRFTAPQPISTWTEVRDATRFGPGCSQTGESRLNPVPEMSEDCLTLNVWSHHVQSAKDALLPVMVWLHGGGFVTGAGSSPLYEASRLALTGNVVVVSLNYRLGALGFLATEQLRSESNDGSVGNYGLQDQVAALEWVARNIEVLGGDPNNVTLFGESSGGVSVCAHLSRPESRGLFHKAIVQSGGGCSEIPELSADPLLPGGTLGRGQAFIAASPCGQSEDPIGCLREQPVEALLAAQEHVPPNAFGSKSLGPSVDGVFLRGQPYALLEQDPAAAVPLLTGSAEQEFELFLFGGAIVAETEADYQRLAESLTGSDAAAAALKGVYPLTDYASPRDAASAMGTDYVYTCPALALAQLMGDRAPAFTYDFRGTLGGLAGAVGPAHGIDIPFIFGTLDASSLLSYDAADRVLSTLMQQRWGEFARSGAPSKDSTWQEESEGAYILAEGASHMLPELREGRCERLRELGLVPKR